MEIKGVETASTGANAHQSNVSVGRVLAFLGFQVCLFFKACSIRKGSLEFNQQKSSLSHKERALKSYYAPQSLQCFSVMLQHSVGYLDTIAN